MVLMGFISWLWNFGRNTGMIILCLFVAFCVYMYFNQNNLIYPTELNGMKVPEDNPAPYQNPEQFNMNYKNVVITTKDKLRLHGWLVYTGPTPNKTLIYFHENAGNIGFRLPFLEFVLKSFKMNCLLVGYRGYGKSEGIPSEDGLKIDGEAIAQWAFDTNNETVRNFIDQQNIFLFGRSLGGAVAAHVAAKCNLPFKGIIIENTFSSMGDMVNSLYPVLKFLQIYLLKNKWETKEIIGQITYPMLYCRSENDELISKGQMDHLVKASTKARFVDYYTIKKGTHNEGFRYDPTGYINAIKEFMSKCDDMSITSKINESTTISNDDIKKNN